uniref:AlNc14C440G11665 protein n=1 Tax=Albugo laibachii Nc14 TaxID=890382 RepID=F0WZS4_9STRA|nr:AlNc14C440G11665 [Albugo laibachii Nc14]|eukprot:CCA27001.1 AlNc14C440G11665 [Albugo laibachii Nc14]
MDKLLRADLHVTKAASHVAGTSNGDGIIKFASKYPISLHGVLHTCMRDNNPDITNVAQVHMINRVLAASDPSSDNTFLHKWSKSVGGKVPSKRQELFDSVAHWWGDSPNLEKWKLATHALAFFELMMLCTAPTLFCNDHWAPGDLDSNTSLSAASHQCATPTFALPARNFTAQRVIKWCYDNYSQRLSWIYNCRGSQQSLRSRPLSGSTLENIWSTGVPAQRVRSGGSNGAATFFLPTGSFEANASHIVCGDLNTTLCPSIDCSSSVYRHEPSRLSCLEWLSNLGVIDAWRQQHPEERVFTGPQPRKNRLDYILLSESLFQSVYKDSSYVSLPHTGDHLAHIATFANPSQLQVRGYWKCPFSLFDYPIIKEAIEEEADRILGQLRASTHPGTVWEKWKKHVKHLLQRIHQKIRHQEEKDVIRAQAGCNYFSQFQSRTR